MSIHFLHLFSVNNMRIFGSVSEDFGAIWEPFGGRFWPLEAPWGRLEASWKRLGRLGALWGGSSGGLETS